jgi:CBS domain-containing protein
MDAIRTMAGAKSGSVLVVDDDRLVGIFSERDVMFRVVLEGRHPEYTTVEEVMTSSVQTIPPETTSDAALRIMHQSHIRHLPVVDGLGDGQMLNRMPRPYANGTGVSGVRMLAFVRANHREGSQW